VYLAEGKTVETVFNDVKAELGMPDPASIYDINIGNEDASLDTVLTENAVLEFSADLIDITVRFGDKEKELSVVEGTELKDVYALVQEELGMPTDMAGMVYGGEDESYDIDGTEVEDDGDVFIFKQHKLTLVCGVNEIEAEGLLGKTVGAIRAQYKEQLNLPAKARIYVDSSEKNDDYEIAAEDSELEFTRPSGKKG
jgi:hypothetical protein